MTDPYEWRGKKHKSIASLSKAVRKEYPRGRVSFGALEMHVCYSGGTQYIFDVVRHEDKHEICDHPKISR